LTLLIPTHANSHDAEPSTLANLTIGFPKILSFPFQNLLHLPSGCFPPFVSVINNMIVGKIWLKEEGSLFMHIQKERGTRRG